MKISIIIPTRNRAKYLRDTLQSLVLSNVHDAELLIIDNGSTDLTKDVASDFIKKSNFECHYIYEQTPGLHIGRNLGAQLAQGEILAYLDDDVFVEPSWFTAIHDTFQSYPHIALLGGPCIPYWENTPPKWIYNLKASVPGGGWVLNQLSLVNLCYSKISRCHPFYIFGCNFIIRKDILFSAGGFHPDGMPDSLLCYRGDGETYISKFIDDNNLSSFYHPDCKIFHRVPSSRLTADYIKYINVRNTYSLAYTQCRESQFLPRKFLKILYNNFKLAIKNFSLFLIGKEKFSTMSLSFLLIKICLGHMISKSRRLWVCQKSYFLEDPCPYK